MHTFNDLYQLPIVLLCLLFLISHIGEATHICYGTEEKLLKDRLSTKTGYFAVPKNENFLSQYKKEALSCSAEQVWVLTRHGTRYPLQSYYDNYVPILKLISEEVVANHHQGRGCLDEETVRQLDGWTPPCSLRDEGQLQDTGFEELYSIGKHWKDLFPDIFNKSYNTKTYKVEFTIKNRTEQSAYHFLRGMFGDDAVGKIELPKPYTPNFLLRFYKSCPRWLREVYKNNETNKELLLFEKGEEYQSVTHAISARLGFMHALQPVEVASIYEQCRYESAWWPDYESPWCVVFSKRDIQILEYKEDLKYYYQNSYGNDLNAEIACKTVSDLYTRLKGTVSSGISEPQAVLYFSHDKALLSVLTALGLFRPPVHLMHNNFSKMMDRSFRTSAIASFANNIGFVLFKCSNEYKVGLFFRGDPIPFSSVCKDNILCPWVKVAKFLEPIYTNCDLSKFCMLHDEL